MANTDIGIDLGTSNIVMTMGNRGVVLSEPSVIAYNTRTERVLAVGREAYEMIGRNPDYIAVARPISEGVISDDDLTHSMIREFILKVSGHQLVKPRIIICVPSFITDIESRARCGKECRFASGIPHSGTYRGNDRRRSQHHQGKGSYDR